MIWHRGCGVWSVCNAAAQPGESLKPPEAAYSPVFVQAALQRGSISQRSDPKRACGGSPALQLGGKQMKSSVVALCLCAFALGFGTRVAAQGVVDAAVGNMRVRSSGAAVGPSFRFSAGASEVKAVGVHPDETARWQVVEDRPGGNVLIIRGAHATQGELSQHQTRGMRGADGKQNERLPRRVLPANANRRGPADPEFQLSEPGEFSAASGVAPDEISSRILRVANEFPNADVGSVLAAGDLVSPEPAAAVDGAHSLTRQRPALQGVAEAVVTALQLEWKSLPEVSAGKAAEATLLLQNRGMDPVSGVQVEVVAPAGCQMLACEPEAVNLEPTMRWKLGILPPGESRELKLQFLAEDASAVGLQAFVSIVAEAAAVVPVLRPGLAITARCETAGIAGRSVAVDVDVTNPGSGVTDDVVVTAMLPTGLSYRERSEVQIPVGMLHPGETRRVRLNLDALRGGAHDVSIVGVATGGLQATSGVAIKVSEPQVAVSIVGPTAITAGETCQLLLQISNVGPVETSNLYARYHLPVGAELLDGGRGRLAEENGRMLQWFVGSLRPGEQAELPFRIRGLVPGSLVHEGAAIAEQGLPAACRMEQEVAGVAKLEIASGMIEAEASSGAGVSWLIRVRNNGTVAATAIGVSCEMPAGLTLISAEGPSQYLAENGIVIFRTLRELAPAAEISFRFRAEQLRPGLQEVRTRLVADQLGEPMIERTLIERPSAAISE